MRSKGKSPLRWPEREEQLGVWLTAREAEQRRAEQIPRVRRLRAYATLWGWMPPAVIIFWIAYILTRSISFHDESASPEYKLVAFGTGDATLTAEFIEDPPDGAHLALYVPQGVRIVRINDVVGEGACSSGKARYQRVNRVWRVELSFDKTIKDQEILYGKDIQATYLTCKLNWHPLHDSYATYRVRVDNTNFGRIDDVAAPDAYTVRNINVGAPYMENVRLAAIAGAAIRVDERMLVNDDFVNLGWTRGDAEQSRDIVLIVIGALIALGAAVVVEALRGELELAIEANQPTLPGDASAP